jgi:hypothetical protein
MYYVVIDFNSWSVNWQFVAVRNGRQESVTGVQMMLLTEVRRHY